MYMHSLLGFAWNLSIHTNRRINQYQFRQVLTVVTAAPSWFVRGSIPYHHNMCCAVFLIPLLRIFLDGCECCCLCPRWISSVEYVRIPFPDDVSFILMCLLVNRLWQGDILGRWTILTTHLFSMFEIAWRWEGRSMRKSPYSSVFPLTQFDLLLFLLLSHETATNAPVNSN